MQPFQCHIEINSDHMQYLYQKGKRALPGSRQNVRYYFLLPPPSHQMCLSLPPHFLPLLSLLSFFAELLLFIMMLSITWRWIVSMYILKWDLFFLVWMSITILFTKGAYTASMPLWLRRQTHAHRVITEQKCQQVYVAWSDIGFEV
jgi:hypothetical protein